ncbi:alpha-ketoglutarate-dependent taurine dioxygenase-like [Ptychodera flava]|uniref:alpha-ketoglutarate-dependent taurine dioxygenase-like n=1 Tax=Ptychodera flava TaxID=63121 RepID=UPI00396A18D1
MARILLPGWIRQLSWRLTVVNFITLSRSVIMSTAHDFYQLKPIKLGCEVRGIDLTKPVSDEVVAQIKRDVTEHRILVFKDQHNLAPVRHIQISKWFGELESSSFYKHPKSPSTDIFRVSNDESEGCTNVGRTGWHIDGTFFAKPYSYSVYHMVHVPAKGDTVFAPLNEIIMGLPESQRNRWDRLWMVSDRRGGVIHPLIYSHPESGEKTLCIHMGMTDSFTWDKGTPQERMTDWKETSQLLQEINHEFIKNDKAIQYSHQWQVGDFIISDNLAVGHEASPDSQTSRAEVGLRVLHRITVAGKEAPTKKYALPDPQKDEL